MCIHTHTYIIIIKYSNTTLNINFVHITHTMVKGDILTEFKHSTVNQKHKAVFIHAYLTSSDQSMYVGT